ncbi:hypothetical protein ACFQS1_37160 [Paractinoplanes rhizophilus]|uniref:XRE family transcriptional regulator n=1 Tax=Paractinoplanes rhizophilus TaxID=1416877 RepID=A0ABW2I410_9ACTN
MARPSSRQKNQKLIDARLRLTSASGETWTPQNVADEMNAFLWAQYQKDHQEGRRSRKPTILDHRFVSSYESGRHRWPTRQYRAAFRYALRVETDAELGFTPERRRTGKPKLHDQAYDTARAAVTGETVTHLGARWPDPTEPMRTAALAAVPAPSLDADDSPVLATRRQSMLLLGMATVAAAFGLRGSDTGPRRQIGRNDLSQVSAIISLYRSMDSEFGGGVLVDDVDQIAQSASGLLDHIVPDALLPELFTVLANARYLAAWTAFDATRHTDAQRHFMAAERYAMESGNRRLLAHVRYGQAKQLQHLRQNRDALHTLRLAHHQLDPTPGVLAVLRGAEAASHAALGDAERAKRALGQSSDAFAAVDPSKEPEWLDFLDEGELLAQYGRVYRDMARAERRHGDDAVRWVAEAISSFGTQNVRSTLLNQVGLCSAYFLADAPDLALQAGHAAQELANTVTSKRVVERLANLRRDAADHLHHSDVADFIHSLPATV